MRNRNFNRKLKKTLRTYFTKIIQKHGKKYQIFTSDYCNLIKLEFKHNDGRCLNCKTNDLNCLTGKEAFSLSEYRHFEPHPRSNIDFLNAEDFFDFLENYSYILKDSKKKKVEISLISEIQLLERYDLYERILDFKSFPDGWDNGIGEKMREEAVSDLYQFLMMVKEFSNTPSVFFTRNGNLQLGWECDFRQVEIEFLGNSTVDLFYEPPSSFTEVEKVTSVSQAAFELEAYGFMTQYEG